MFLSLGLFPLLQVGMQAAGNTPVTLDTAIHEALNRPVFVKSQKAVLDELVAKTELDKTLESPVFNVSAHYNFGANAELGLSDVSFERDRLSFSANYYIYDDGKRKDNVKAAEAAAKAQNETNSAEKRTLIADVTTVFFDGLSAETLLEVANSELTYANAHLTDVEERLKLGDATKGEEDTAQSAVELAKSDVETFKGALESSEIRLANIMGRDPKKDRPYPTAASFSSSENEDLDEWLTKAEASSPVLRSIRDQVDSARFSMSAVKAGYSPTLQALSGAGYVGYQDPFVGAHSFTRPYVFLELRAVLPLFDRASYKESVRAQQDTIDSKQLDYEKELDQLRTQIVEAYSNLTAVRAAIRSGEAALVASTEAFRLAKERYAQGVGTQNEVLNALANLSIANQKLAAAKLRMDGIVLNVQRLTGEGQAQ